MKRFVVFFLMGTLAFSCNSLESNPEKIFKTIGLNGNKIPSNFKRAFDEIRGQKKVGNLKIYAEETKTYVPATAQEYVDAYYSKMFDEDIKKVKELKGDSESQPIIDVSLQTFQFADEIYKNDYPRIAKMIDEGRSDEEVNLVLKELDATKGVELNAKYDKTLDLLLPYADKHGIEYKTMKGRFK